MPTTLPTNRWPEATWGGGGLGGWVWEGRLGGGGAPSGAIWGVHAPKAKRWSITGSPYLPLPPSNHTTTLNLTLTFAASWFGHANHVH